MIDTKKIREEIPDGIWPEAAEIYAMLDEIDAMRATVTDLTEERDAVIRDLFDVIMRDPDVANARAQEPQVVDLHRLAEIDQTRKS